MKKTAITVILPVVLIILAGCGGGGNDKSFTNPDWRESVASSVSFPLENEITIQAILGNKMESPNPDAESIKWIKEKTNINLEFINVPSSPGDVNFGMMIPEGNLPDLVWEDRIPEEEDMKIFTNILEFPELTPNFHGLVREDESFRKGILSKVTSEGKLYTFGTYDADFLPMASVLAFREDLFSAHNLKTATWDEIYEAVKFLKLEYPRSAPFGGRFNDILYIGPGWFGSGLSRDHVVYWDPEVNDWVFGPADDGFRDFVSYFAKLNEDGLLSPDLLMDSQTPLYQYYQRGTVFIGPYKGFTGPRFPYDKSEYGALTDEGGWNGKKAWISALPLPDPPSGGTSRASSNLYSNVSTGWMVYNQSDYVGEALALLDFLYSEEASAVLALGPEETAWAASGEKAELLEPYRDIYLTEGKGAVSEKLNEEDIITKPFPAGQLFDWYENFGYPEYPGFQYLLKKDLAVNTPGEEIIMQPGVQIPLGNRKFVDERLNLIMALQSEVESNLSRFILGQRDMEEYDQFLREVEDLGNRLLELYREWCKIPEVEF